MSFMSTIQRGRQFVATTLVDSGRILAPAHGAGTVDPVTFRLEPPAPTVVYEGPCLVRIPTVVEQQHLFGDATVNSTRFVSKWTWSIPEVHVGYHVELLEANDPHITDRLFRVVGIDGKTANVWRLLGMEVIER